MLSLLISL
ncbi:UNVERIFIED_CONTAM: hypothetical protein GTU68_016969 [Idotea baltica]|nr:hypothetical protein [Idotea baltica]